MVASQADSLRSAVLWSVGWFFLLPPLACAALTRLACARGLSCNSHRTLPSTWRRIRNAVPEPGYLEQVKALNAEVAQIRQAAAAPPAQASW